MSTGNIVSLADRAPPGFRVPPHNIEAEQSLLGSILINNDAYHQVSTFLRPAHFYEPVHGRIYDAMTRLIDGGHIADHITLRAQFEQDEALRDLNGEAGTYLARMARAAETILNARDYGQAICELAVRRGIIQISEHGANKAFDCSVTEDGFEQVAELRHMLDELAGEVPRETWRSVASVAGRIESRLTATAEMFSTMLPSLDNHMSGGLQRGLTYGFEAPMKSFKTGLLGTLALALIKQKIPAGMLTLEMGAERVLERLIAAHGGINAIRFRKRETPDDLRMMCRSFQTAHADAPFFFGHEPGCTFARLKAICEEAVHSLGLEVLLIDYLQRVGGAAPKESLERHLSSVANWAADFGARTNTTIVLTSQSNQEGGSYYGNGLRRACDWFAEVHKVDCTDRFVGDFEGLWAKVTENRDGPDNATIGTAEHPAFRIDKHGPVLREYGDW